MPTTSWPRSSSASARNEPMKPATPVTTTCPDSGGAGRVTGGTPGSPARGGRPRREPPPAAALGQLRRLGGALGGEVVQFLRGAGEVVQDGRAGRVDHHLSAGRQAQ